MVDSVIMNIDTSSVARTDLSNAVSVATARKTLDVAQQQGQAMVSMIQQAAQAGLGGTTPVPATPGAGSGRVDVYG